jgi:hypothetical protein
MKPKIKKRSLTHENWTALPIVDRHTNPADEW